MNNQSYTGKAGLAYAKSAFLKGGFCLLVLLLQTNFSNAQEMAFAGNSGNVKTEVKSKDHTEPIVELKTVFVDKVKKEINAGSGAENAIEIVYSSFFTGNLEEEKFQELVRIKAEVLKEMVKCEGDGVN